MAVAATYVAVVALGMATSTAASLGYRVVLYPLALPLSLLAAHALVIRWFEGGNWNYASLGASAAQPRRWLLASVFGGTAIALPAALLLVIGQLSIVPAPEGSSLTTAAYLFWLLVPAALGEELLARGYIFSLIREAWGSRAALILTSAGFGLLHLANPGSNPQAILTVVLAGLFLGLVLIRYASLYAAWTAHAAWNLVLSAMMHANVSGVALTGTPDYRIVDTGPDWLTGGTWGPEGGVAAAAGLAAASLLLVRPLLRGAGSARNSGESGTGEHG